MDSIVLKLVVSCVFGLIVMFVTRFVFKRVDLSPKAFWLGCLYAFCGLGVVFWAIVICAIPMFVALAREQDKKAVLAKYFCKNIPIVLAVITIILFTGVFLK